MPLGKASYGELGNWGRKGKKISRKKILIISILLIFALIFSISNNSVFPIPRVLGDYNTSFSHTRTNIFTDTSFNGPSAFGLFSQTVRDCGAFPCSVTASIAPNSEILVEENTNGCATPTDSFSNTYSQTQCIVISTGSTIGDIALFSASSVTGGSDTVTLSGLSPVASFLVLDYVGFSGFGNSGTFSTITASGSNTQTITVSQGSIVLGQAGVHVDGVTCGSENPTSGQTRLQTFNCDTISGAGSTNSIVTTSGSLSSGSYSDTVSWSGGGAFGRWIQELKGAFIQDFSKVRWNFNSTCVSLQGSQTPQAVFDYSLGSSGSGGNNCNSADVMISKSSINLQSVSGRMMEIVDEWSPNALNSPIRNVTLVLRTNGTLPSFTEGYNPLRDTNARLIWQACPIQFCTGGLSSLWVVHDQSKTLNQESQTNDLIISGPNSNFNNAAGPNQNAFQVVLNFTGPLNYQQSNVVTNSTNLASSLQFGQDYYILVQAQFDTTQSPGALKGASFAGGINPTNGSGNPSFGIWSVPSSCTDPVNKVACSLPTAQPVFQFNPLDPSTWGNAIIKGFLWVFTVGVPQGFTVMSAALIVAIRLAGNFIGGFFGQGNLGDNTATFLTGIGSLMLQAGTVIGWLSNIITSPITMISILLNFVASYFPGLTNLLNDVKNGTPLIVLLPVQIAIWFPNSYMVVMIFFYFLLVMANGTRGFFEWIHLVKWSSFHLWNVFMRFLKGIIDGITWVLGRISIISPGHKLTNFPHFEPGPLPHLDLHVNDLAIFHDPLAWFFSVIGFVFVALFAGTSASGLPASSVANIASLQSLFLSLFGMIFMMLLLYIPSWLIMKLQEGAYKK